MGQQPESKLVGKIVAAINELDGCKAQKIHGSPWGKPLVDILVCKKGRLGLLEAKVDPKAGPTPRQAATLRSWANSGAFVGCVHSVDEALEIVRQAELYKTV